MSTIEKSDLQDMFIEVLTPYFNQQIEQREAISAKMDEIINASKPREL